ncbi:MAG: hypothetical protein R3C45_19610 [Phycisphaerales bacterium]
MAQQPSQLRPLGFTARLGLSLLVLTLLGGLTVSGLYMAWHHENRDERSGLTMNDIRGHYAGVNIPSPLLEALKRHHPEGQSEKNRQVLMDWLQGDRIVEDFDNLDLSEITPDEIIASDCMSCHSRQATGENAYPQLPFDYFDDIRAIAFSSDIRPVGTEVLAASTHTHAISLAVLALVSCGLMLLTGWPRGLVNPIVLLMGFGLALDLSGWWIARVNDAVVPLIVVGGFIFAASVAAALLLVLADLWRPSQHA